MRVQRIICDIKDQNRVKEDDVSFSCSRDVGEQRKRKESMICKREKKERKGNFSSLFITFHQSRRSADQQRLTGAKLKSIAILRFVNMINSEARSRYCALCSLTFTIDPCRRSEQSKVLPAFTGDDSKCFETCPIPEHQLKKEIRLSRANEKHSSTGSGA